MKHIVIAGGGFTGVRLARKLRRLKNISVTIINESDEFRYSPALYRAATGFKIGIARIPLEWMLLDSSNTSLVIGRVKSINKQKKSIGLEDGSEIEYDYAVIALGAVTTYFGIDGLDEHSYGVKTFDEIIELKHHMHDSLVSKNPKKQNYVIVGAGPTGVELAGALGSYLKKISKMHKIKHPKTKVFLVEAGPRILPQMSKRAARKVLRRLERLKVVILTDTTVKSETARSLKTSDGPISTHNVIWTAGTVNNPFFKDNEKLFSFDDRGRVLVNKRLQTSRNIYVCGDNAATVHSGLAVTAVNHGNFMAKELTARVTGKKRPTLHEKYPVQIVPAGGRWSVLQYRRLVLSGNLMGLTRRLADIVGYTEVLGPIKALTIWQSSDRAEDHCGVCRVR